VKRTSRTALSFKEDQMDVINELKKALAGSDQKILSSRELFLLGMAYGFSSRNKISGWKRLNNGVRLEYMQPKDETLLTAVSVAEHGDPKCLRDIEAVFDLAEDYAAGGIALLAAALRSERNFHAWIEGEVFSSFQSAIEKTEK
jgi:hypothetical protein